jgi:NADPH-dependent glutamate synthase beta subunit-like oxidoreductase
VVISNILNIIDNVYENVEEWADVLKLITKTNNTIRAI